MHLPVRGIDFVSFYCFSIGFLEKTPTVWYLLPRHEDVFVKLFGDLGRTGTVQHKFNTGTIPIFQPVGFLSVHSKFVEISHQSICI